MPVPTAEEWRKRLEHLNVTVTTGDVNSRIGESLRAVEQKLGFFRYEELGKLQKLLLAEHGFKKPFDKETPKHVETLVTELMEELRGTALYVGQNEYATVGPLKNTCPFIYSTGFVRCRGVVLFDGMKQIATLAHIAPSTAAEMSVERLVIDFVEAGGILKGEKTAGFVFGGQEGVKDAEKRKKLLELLGHQTPKVSHVSLTDLKVSGTWGVLFNRTNGEYAGVVGAPATAYAGNVLKLSLMSQQRSSTCGSNDNRSDKAELLLATRC